MIPHKVYLSNRRSEAKGGGLKQTMYTTTYEHMPYRIKNRIFDILMVSPSANRKNENHFHAHFYKSSTTYIPGILFLLIFIFLYFSVSWWLIKRFTPSIRKNFRNISTGGREGWWFQGHSIWFWYWLGCKSKISIPGRDEGSRFSWEHKRTTSNDILYDSMSHLKYHR